MNHNQHRPNFADTMKLAVTYRGVNAVGQHLFCNGSPLVTDLYPTLEEAVSRFGARIELGDKTMAFSGPFNAAVADVKAGKKYAPRQGASTQEKLEYGLGYLKGLLTPKPVVLEKTIQARVIHFPEDPMGNAVVIVVPPKESDGTSPTPPPVLPIKRPRGRPKKVK